MKNTPWQTKPHQKILEHKMCLTICINIVTKPHLGKVCIVFTNTVKVGAVRLPHCCIIILVVGIIIDYVFIKHCLYFKKKAVKIGAPKFWPSYHYSSTSVVQTASNWNLQKLLKSEL